VEINPEIIRYYTQSRVELNRLSTGHSQFEKARTQQIIQRHLSDKPLKILDVGGGVGTYSFWLSELGNEVHLIDPVPLHIEEAKKQSVQYIRPPSSIKLGEARTLEFGDEYFDLVLLLGPLYHLAQKEERIAALKEANRVTRKGSILFCAAISRLAFLLDVLFHDILPVNPKTIGAIERHLQTGQIRNPGELPGAFTTAYAHQIGELKEEIIESGLNLDQLISIDGFGWLIPDFEQKWQQTEYQESLLKVSQILESNESILGQSAHLMAIASKSRPLFCLLANDV